MGNQALNVCIVIFTCNWRFHSSPRIVFKIYWIVLLMIQQFLISPTFSLISVILYTQYAEYATVILYKRIYFTYINYSILFKEFSGLWVFLRPKTAEVYYIIPLFHMASIKQRGKSEQLDCSLKNLFLSPRNCFCQQIYNRAFLCFSGLIFIPLKTLTLL